MNNWETGLRKAAILVTALDRSMADALLEHMGAEQSRRVRDAVVDLGPIDPEEERRVIDEFLRVGPMVPRDQHAGIELDERLARRLADQSYRVPEPSAPDDAPETPFRFLRQTECEELGRILAGERPQTIALVLSHLPSEQAGRVLVLFSPATQAEVIRRLVDLEETDPDVLREVERGLQSRLAQRLPMRRRRRAGAAAVSGILKSSEQAVGRQILDNLAMHDERLAHQFAPASPEPPKIGPVEFDDFMQFNRASLAAVLDAAGTELLTLALVGAPATVSDHMLRPLPRHHAESVRHDLANPVPTRLSDVEGARRQLAELARSLAMSGRIELPSRESLIEMTV